MPVLQASIDAIPAKRKRGRPRKDASAPTASAQEAAEPEPEPVIDVYQAEDDYIAQVRSWLQFRIDVVGSLDDSRATRVPDSPQALRKLGWPSLGLPTLIGSKDHTPEQLALIEQLLVEVEGRAGMPFGEPKPEPTQQMARLLHLFPQSTIINEQESPA